MNAIARAGTSLLNAMAFANAGNDSECRALLRRLPDAALAPGHPAQPEPCPRRVARALAAAAGRPARRAL